MKRKMIKKLFSGILLSGLLVTVPVSGGIAAETSEAVIETVTENEVDVLSEDSVETEIESVEESEVKNENEAENEAEQNENGEVVLEAAKPLFSQILGGEAGKLVFELQNVGNAQDLSVFINGVEVEFEAIDLGIDLDSDMESPVNIIIDQMNIPDMDSDNTIVIEYTNENGEKNVIDGKYTIEKETTSDNKEDSSTSSNEVTNDKIKNDKVTDNKISENTYEVNKSGTQNPKTGDSENIFVWIGTMVASLIFLVYVYNKNKSCNEI